VKRRLFNAAALVSLVVCAALTLLWLRSYWLADHFDVPYKRLQTMILSESGSLSFCWINPPAPRFGWHSFSPQGGSAFGFGFVRADGPVSILFFPHWLPAGLFAVLPTVWFVGRHLARRRGDVCGACGYDLRGTPGWRCPECGASRLPPT
jgi:hypothetical protein